MEKIASIMDATVTKMYDNMKTIMENNMAATSAMIQESISTAFNKAPHGESGPQNSALGLGHVEYDSASDAAEK
eukprot:14277364-Ditylum_brightwellii.AAC.1